MQNQRGFAAMRVIGIVIIVIIAGAAYSYWSQHSNRQTARGAAETTQQSSSTPSNIPSATITVSPSNPTTDTPVSIFGTATVASLQTILVGPDYAGVIDSDTLQTMAGPDGSYTPVNLENNGFWHDNWIPSVNGKSKLAQGRYTIYVLDYATGAMLASSTFAVRN